MYSHRSIAFRGHSNSEIWIAAYEHPWMADDDISRQICFGKFHGTKVVVCSIDTWNSTMQKIAEFDDINLDYSERCLLQCQGGTNIYCFCVQKSNGDYPTIYTYTRYGQSSYADPLSLKRICEKIIWLSIIERMKSLNNVENICNCLPVYMREKLRRIRSLLGLH